MGNTFRLLGREVWMPWKASFGDVRAPSLCRPPVGRGSHDGRLPGFWDIPEDWLQDIRSLQGARAFGPGRPVHYANQLPQQVESLIVRLKAEKPEDVSYYQYLGLFDALGQVNMWAHWPDQ